MVCDLYKGESWYVCEDGLFFSKELKIIEGKVDLCLLNG